MCQRRRNLQILDSSDKFHCSVLKGRYSVLLFLLKNEYIDTSIQKAGVPGFSGCLEHNTVITELIREAKEDKGNLATVWLDLANAYGSVPHRLIERAMTQYHIPDNIQDIIRRYYNNIKVRFTIRSFTTKFQHLDKGIVTGCTVSVILFVMAINLKIKFAEKEGRGPLSRSGIRQPSIRAFMDDMAVMTTRGMSAHWIIRKLDETIE